MKRRFRIINGKESLEEAEERWRKKWHENVAEYFNENPVLPPWPPGAIPIHGAPHTLEEVILPTPLPPLRTQEQERRRLVEQVTEDAAVFEALAAGTTPTPTELRRWPRSLWPERYSEE